MLKGRAVENPKQLNVTRADVLFRGVRGCCPNCGQRGLMASWFHLNQRCKACGMDLAKSHGFYSGTTSIGYVASIIFVIIPICFLVVGEVLSVRAGVLLGIGGSFGFIVLIYPLMLCWMVMAYHFVLPEELPANQADLPPEGSDRGA